MRHNLLFEEDTKRFQKSISQDVLHIQLGTKELPTSGIYCSQYDCTLHTKNITLYINETIPT